MANFILGTRGSLLAVTQSSIVANELQQKYPQHQFLLKTIKTQGDMITNKPLWQIDGKDFFTKELDEALISKEVDFVVHSYKDLSTERPKGIFLSAITERKFPHDALVIKKETLIKIQTKKITTLVVGTSSPRRQFLLQKNIKKILPFGKELTFRFENLRGNVNTRIEKLKSNEYDVICLALAGLERLTNLEDSNIQLSNLLNELEIKLLPISIFPPAPAQGALAIECLDSNLELKKILYSLHSDKTAKEVTQEKNIFKKYGGGCHLALGVHVKGIGNNSYYIHASGFVEKKTIKINDFLKDQFDLKHLISQSSNKVFIGLSLQRLQELELSHQFVADELKITTPVHQLPPAPIEESGYLVTSEHCINAFNHYIPIQNHNFVWASGVIVHEKLSELGYWVHGDNDSLGSEILQTLQKSNLGNFISKKKQLIELSYDNNPTKSNKVWNTYSSIFDTKNISERFRAQLLQCNIFFWTSYRQFDFYSRTFPEILIESMKHFCGYGKTLKIFHQNNFLDVVPLPSLNFFLTQFNKE